VKRGRHAWPDKQVVPQILFCRAAEMGIGEKTIKVHRGHVMEKLGVQSSGQLLAMVLRVVLTKE
jgi:DNA-binding CsgD family transcriptional regulator